MKKQLIYGIPLTLFSTLVLAHQGHGISNAYAGFMHPFMGWDHILMMVAVGIFAAKSKGNIRWQLPLTFISVMVIGAFLGFLGLGIAVMETAIASSVIAMGVLIIINLPIPTKVSVSLVAMFALLHGSAHGLELNGAQNNSALLGMLLATATLHGIGYLIGLQKNQMRVWLNNGLAFTMMEFGTFLLVY